MIAHIQTGSKLECASFSVKIFQATSILLAVVN